MRDFDTGFNALALSGVRKSWWEVTQESQLLQFSALTQKSLSGVATDIPPGISVCSNGTLCYTAFLPNSGGFIVKPVASIANADWTSTYSGTGLYFAPGQLRAATETQYLHVARWSWNNTPTVYRYSLPVTSSSSATALFTVPETMLNSSTMVRRIEAVCTTSNGVLVAVGCHNFATGYRFSTIKFYLYDGSTVRELYTKIQIPMDDSLTYSSWHACAHYCANIFATSMGSSTLVVANDAVLGRAVTFCISAAGVESQVERILPIDVDASDVTFLPTGLVKHGNLYYLSGHFRRPKTNDQDEIIMTDRLSMYLTSANGINWSAGERSSFVTTQQMQGQLVFIGDSPSTVYYIGPSTDSVMKLYAAAARDIDKASATKTEIDAIEWSLDQTAGNADSLTLAPSGRPDVHEGDVLTFSAGYISGETEVGGQIGKYIVTGAADQVSNAGYQPPQISAMDFASKRLKEWKSPIDIDRWSTTRHEDALNALSQLVAKTPIRDAEIKSNAGMTLEELRKSTGKTDVSITDGWLYSNALNDPFVGFSTDPDERDGIMTAEVEYQAVGNGCQQSFGFVFGGSSDDYKFNAITFPHSANWTGYIHTKPEIWTSNLPPVVLDTDTDDDDDEDISEDLDSNGWTIEARVHGIVSSISSDTYARILKPLVSSATTVSQSTADAASLTPYEYAIFKHGSLIQAYMHKKDYSPANASANATWTKVATFEFHEYDRMSFADTSYSGIVKGTDVPSSKEWFVQSEYGDLELQLTDASDSASNSSSYTVLLKGDGTSGSPGCSRDGQFVIGTNGVMTGIQGSNFSGETPLSFFHSSTMLYIPSVGTKRVQWVDANSKTVKLDLTLNHSGYFDVYALGPSDAWGTADSGYTKTTVTIDGTTVTQYTDTGATYTDTIVAGTGYFVTDDQTAASLRRVETNGVGHTLRSGNDVSGSAWDPVSPIAYGEPESWRLLLHHGRFFVGKSSDYGLGDKGYFKVDDEYIRYWTTVAYKRGDYQQHLASNAIYWCEIPTFYSTINGVAANSTSFTNWSSNAGNGFADIETAFNGTVGTTNYAKDMLVEISSRSSTTDIDTSDSSASFHVDHVASKTLYLDQAYPNAIEQPYPNTQTGHANSTDGAVVIVSGRGQMGSDKELHDSDASVVFYPMPITSPAATQPFDWLMRVGHYDHYNGTYHSVEDDLKAICAFAGVRSTEFNSVYSGTLSINYAATSLGLSDVADFVMDASVTLQTYPCMFETAFRNGNYKLRICAVDVSGNGNLRIMLTAPKSTIAPTSSGARVLGDITVPLTRGCTLTGKTVKLRIVVLKHDIQVECDGVLVWVFNLERMTYKDSSSVEHNWIYEDSGDVLLSYSGLTATSSITVNLQELYAESENRILDMGTGGSDSISDVIGDRHILTRSTEDGGICFSRFTTHEDWGERLVDQLGSDQTGESTDGIAGHILVSGAEFGEYIDEEWMQEHGYLFDMGSNKLLGTIQDSCIEARQLANLAKQQLYTRSVLGPMLANLQPQDKVRIYRPASGSTPEIAEAYYVVLQNTLSGGQNGAAGTLTLRRMGDDES